MNERYLAKYGDLDLEWILVNDEIKIYKTIFQTGESMTDQQLFDHNEWLYQDIISFIETEFLSQEDFWLIDDRI